MKQGGDAVTPEKLSDAVHRDVYGDVFIELASQKFDLAVRYAGDFMLYFASEQTGGNPRPPNEGGNPDTAH